MANALSSKDAYNVMLKDYPDVMNIEQMSRILGVSTKTGYRLLRDGAIISLRIGRNYRIPKAHVITFLKVGQETNHVERLTSA